MNPTKKLGYLILFAACFLVAAIQLAVHSRLPDHHHHHQQLVDHLDSFKQSGRETRSTTSTRNNSQGRSDSFLPCREHNNQQQEPCCASWDINMDDWWLHHPDWYVSHEEDDRFCFSRIEDPHKAEFFRRVHDLQWNHNATSTCQDVLSAFQTNAGYSASINQIVYGFWSAYQQGLPFQITKHRVQMEWMFAPKNESNWAYCPSKDMTCYYLPLSDCKAEIGAEQKYQAIKPKNKKENRLFQWLRLYATRPQQHVRKHVYDFITKVQGLPRLPWNMNCTGMHIRRGDSGFVKFPWRRYAGVQEYLDKGQIQKGETIVLLTDDATTIDEVETYHATNYNWIYLKRQRTRGTEGGFNKHIPSGDQALEVITIMAEVKLASQCNALVAGDSGFVTTITDAMDAVGKHYKKYGVQTRVKEADVKKDRKMDAKLRVEQMLKEIDSKNEKT